MSLPLSRSSCVAPVCLRVLTSAQLGLGNRVAKAQLRILWEEILKRFERLEVVGKSDRLQHSFVHGVKAMTVIAHPKK